MTTYQRFLTSLAAALAWVALIVLMAAHGGVPWGLYSVAYFLALTAATIVFCLPWVTGE